MMRFKPPLRRTERSEEDANTLRLWIEEVKDYSDKFTDWENTFIDSIDGQLMEKGWLSVGQVESLETIRGKYIRESRR